MDPFTSIYATPAIVPMIASTPLHRGFDSTPNLQSFYGIDPTMTAYQSDSTYDSSNAFMSRSFSVNSLMHSMHHPHQHNTTPLQPQLYQSPQVQFNTPAFYTNTIRNPMMPAFQQPLMQQTPPPPQSSSQAFQQQFTTPQTVPVQGGPVKAPSPPREQSLARQAPSAIRHTRTNSAPLFAPYSRMTPLMLMQQQQQQQFQPDPSVRMTPATIMKLNQTQSPPSIPSPPSPGPFMAKSPFVASTLTSSPLANSEYPHSVHRAPTVRPQCRTYLTETIR
ncbi:hypothetical protein BCR33DRAFT_771229 [Rhizoclosmatium globosum]|uniref:Uncharacterized protein n=1 Tax=Rhizoclosmatium globosum TaxID=329046 RepID=A0A1Y2BEI4_9FUNG|nr:hypothetical protein BCR33DRAFT_771229 [Rhizoclosmatium globosum]|eukprot:ORY33249.1 hypothetical protein BCR33DRAFT_771229 [Rhizoclosmatium globosum]